MSRLAFGLNRWDVSSPQAFAADVRRAEDLGWDYAFTAVNPLTARDPYVMLAFAAMATTTIRLGPLLESPVLVHPAAVAGAIATVDEIAGGRTVLGYGAGDTAVRFLNRRPATVAETEAAAALVRRLLSGDEVDVGAERPARLRHARPVPVWIAAGGGRMLRAAGRVADGVFIRVGRHPANLLQAVAQVRAGASDVGRDPDEVGIGLIFHTIVPDDPDSIAGISRSMAAGYYEYSRRLFDAPGFDWNGPPVEELRSGVYPDFHHAADLVQAGHVVEFIDDAAASSFSLSGSAEEMASQIAETLSLGFRVDLVVPHPVPTPAPGSPAPRVMPQELKGADYVTWFAREVAPRVKSAA
jgi:5,10-methylenetetrahydromethanopterin reductase